MNGTRCGLDYFSEIKESQSEPRKVYDTAKTRQRVTWTLLPNPTAEEE